MFFELAHTDKRARAGVIHTAHGDIATPCFMPVGTQASVKTLDSSDLENLRAPIILGNTYHLHLRPGEEVIAEQGGLHQFMNWSKPILTDSGGFQVFSLGLQKNSKIKSRYTDESRFTDNQTNKKSVNLDSSVNPDYNQGRLVKIDDDGVTFTSHIDGSTHRFTPESAIEIQHKLGADIIMTFDECTPDSADYEYTREAMERTHRWAERCLEYHKDHPVILNEVKNLYPQLANRQRSFAAAQDDNHQQFLFGIIQGANYEDLRKESARFISSLDFDGIAIGGESIGYNMEATKQILDWVAPIIPTDKPHYAMGVGLDPSDLLEAVEHGADMFDCVAPTRLARHGMVYAPGGSRGRLNLKSAACTRDPRPIDADCACSTCRGYSSAYLHHLFNAEEITGLRLATIHNLHFMLNLMRETRQAILADRFEEFKKNWTKNPA